MLDFKFISPTQFVFGRNAEESLVSEASKLGNKILLHYGGGSIKKFGLYDRVKGYLGKAGVEYIELGGVKPNPSLS
ncbi:MAG: iron-containing alcohol dehydrogenase, partial [Spirochaetaceae bacterium]|nr:iron-containing alcohol dehydrogenase [Spirochaetaceae bacterium]